MRVENFGKALGVNGADEIVGRGHRVVPPGLWRNKSLTLSKDEAGLTDPAVPLLLSRHDGFLDLSLPITE